MNMMDLDDSNEHGVLPPTEVRLAPNKIAA